MNEIPFYTLAPGTRIRLGGADGVYLGERGGYGRVKLTVPRKGRRGTEERTFEIPPKRMTQRVEVLEG